MDHKLRRAEEKFEAIFQNASLGILVVNEEGKIILANAFLLKQFGYEDAEELVGKSLELLIPARYLEDHKQLRKYYAQNSETRPMGMGRDLFGIKKDGIEIALEISLSGYSNEEGRFSIAFVSDISPRTKTQKKLKSQRLALAALNKEMESLNKSLEKKVQERTFRLQEALHHLENSKIELTASLSKERDLNEMKSAFVSMASHEFRTPLSTILSSASLLSKYTSEEDQARRDKHIQRIKSSVINLNNILNEFLSLGRMEEGKIQASYSEFDIQQLIQDQCHELSDILKTGQTLNYTHEGNTVVSLDKNLFRNILINLLSNAAKFSNEGSEIGISTEVKEDRITFRVKDHGIGISEKDQQHLFEIFFRGDNALNITGTGLGLHIVRIYAEMMQGTIQFSSKLEEGTEIIINFAT